jgi:hypothetical protein
MVDSNVFINQMLAPAVLISSIGLILLGMNNRFLTVTGRIRELSNELRQVAVSDMAESVKTSRMESVKSQITAMLDRSRLQKLAIFLLYMAMMFTILTVFALAADLADIELIILDYPVVFSITSLVFIFCSVMVEGYEMTMALKTVREDYKNSLQIVEEGLKQEKAE